MKIIELDLSSFLHSKYLERRKAYVKDIYIFCFFRNTWRFFQFFWFQREPALDAKLYDFSPFYQRPRARLFKWGFYKQYFFLKMYINIVGMYIGNIINVYN